jgi:hypothetical protein
MKIKFISATLCALCVSAFSLTAQTNQIPNLLGTNAPIASLLTTGDQILQALDLSWTNAALEAYATYAPKAPQKWGGGFLLAYNVTSSVGLGLGLDWLGSFSLVSINVQLQLPIHPLPKQAPNLIISPFALLGVGTAYSGDGNFNGAVSSIQDVGGYLSFGHFLSGTFNTGVCWGQWTGAGPYDVKRYHVFLGWSIGI